MSGEPERCEKCVGSEGKLSFVAFGQIFMVVAGVSCAGECK